MKPLSRTAQAIQPFQVMAILARARELEAEGKSIIHMEIGEPDFAAAEAVQAAAIVALQQGQTQYSPAQGLAVLRQAIAASYGAPAKVAPERIMVTPGASGALQLVCAALLNPGDEVLMADPGYPCNRHFVQLYHGVPRMIAVDAECNYQLSPELIRRHWSPKTVAVLLASPSNPSGSVILDHEMARIIDTVHELGGVVIVDEIYHGLVYGADLNSALNHSDAVFVINSFSKYYGMTGWRVGWAVVPPAYVELLLRLTQNLFIAASTPGQHAAVAALAAAQQPEWRRRRDIFEQRRDYLVPALQALGFTIAAAPPKTGQKV